MISIVYITCRKNNPFHWFWDGFRNQKKMFPDIPMQLIVVDYWADERTIDLSNDLSVETLHITPLPSIWQGKHQVTSKPYYAAANARNTGFVYAIHPKVAFCDDVSILGNNWLASVIEAAKGNYISLGAYKKISNATVDKGSLISYDVESTDSRWYSCNDDTKVKVTGNNFFGCSFCMPLEAALRINGFDCLTDGIGYEDQSFGQRLSKLGYSFYYDKRMLTFESNDHVAHDTLMLREDRMVGHERYYQILKGFGLNKSIYNSKANKDASHIMVEVATQKGFNPMWNFFSLQELRNKRERGEEIILSDMKYPERWWVDNKLISEM